MPIEVQLFTTDYVLRGHIENDGERLTDVLNLKNEQGLVLLDVQAASLHTLGKVPPMRMAKARVEKNAITMAIPIQRDLTHKSMFRKANRLAFEVVVLMPQFQVQGVIHLTERMDPRKGFTLRPEDFIPLTEAVLSFAPNPSLIMRADTVVFNKKQMLMLAELRARPMQPTTTGQLPPQPGA
ncbi:MAG: hypothetical protein DDG60_06950 [Anaerolineae bacterium]|nr:MAG: hypothetical protein DDG60_06950 [Anaerolineae bacterium]